MKRPAVLIFLFALILTACSPRGLLYVRNRTNCDIRYRCIYADTLDCIIPAKHAMYQNFGLNWTWTDSAIAAFASQAMLKIDVCEDTIVMRQNEIQSYFQKHRRGLRKSTVVLTVKKRKE